MTNKVKTPAEIELEIEASMRKHGITIEHPVRTAIEAFAKREAEIREMVAQLEESVTKTKVVTKERQRCLLLVRRYFANSHVPLTGREQELLKAITEG